MKYLFGFLLFVGLVACQSKKSYDVVLKNGTVYDGLGGKPIEADVAISADTIAAIGKPGEFSGEQEIDVKGLAVAPGFINMLSWATTSLIQDGRSLGDIKQGVTLEVMGEGESMGPLNDAMKAKGFTISAGYGSLKDSTIRIGHMGDHTVAELGFGR